MLKFKSKHQYILGERYVCTLGESDYEDDDFDDCLTILLEDKADDDFKYFIIPEIADLDLYLENYEIISNKNNKITFLVTLMHEVFDHSNELVLPRCEITFELDGDTKRLNIVDVYAQNKMYERGYIIDNPIDMIDAVEISDEQLEAVKLFYSEFIESYSPVFEESGDTF